MATKFRKLNDGWNAEPNAPAESVHVRGGDVILEFALNAFQYTAFSEGDRGRLAFRGCTRYRLGPTNDEGWYRGQCRFSSLAPGWGEFYEVSGDLLDDRVSGWTAIGAASSQGPTRRFLFYLRDSTFEVDAQGWAFSHHR